VALRPNIAGFDLAVFRTLLAGPGPVDRNRAVIADVAARLAPAAADDVRPVLANVRRILAGALPPGGVEAEDASLVNAVIALATTGQRMRWTDSDRTGAAFIDFATRFPAAPSDLAGTAGSGPTMQALVRWALLQRPVLGGRQSDWWSAYGFLSHAEVGRLLSYHRRHPRLGDHDRVFARHFYGWLAEVYETGQDYWFHSSSRTPAPPARRWRSLVRG